MGTMSKEEILKILEDAKDKNSDVPMRLVRQAFEKLPEPCEDAVSRQAVVDFINDIEHRALKMSNDNSEDVLYKTVLATAKAIRGYCKLAPPAQPERKTGKWYKPVGMMPPEYAGVYRCSKCDEIALRDWKHHKQVLSNFCPNCGKYMRTKETDYDYERAVEQLEHDILYEPTFNQDDGSM